MLSWLVTLWNKLFGKQPKNIYGVGRYNTSKYGEKK